MWGGAFIEGRHSSENAYFKGALIRGGRSLQNIYFKGGLIRGGRSFEEIRYVFNFRSIFVQNFMYVILAKLYQSKFCYLPRFIIISSVYWAFSLSINVHAQNMGTQNFMQRKS